MKTNLMIKTWIFVSLFAILLTLSITKCSEEEPIAIPVLTESSEGEASIGNKDESGSGEEGDESGSGEEGDESGSGEEGDESGSGEEGDESGSGEEGDEDGSGEEGDESGSGEEGDESGSGEEGDESGSGEEGDESGSGEEGDESGSGEEGDESGSGEEGDESGSGEEGDESGSGEEGDEGGSGEEGDEGGSGEEGDEGGSGEEGDESGSGEEGDESGSGEEGDESGSGEEGDESGSGEEGDESGSGEEGDESGSGEEGDESGSGEEGDESGSGEEGDESGSGEEGDEGGSGEEGDEGGSGEEGDEGGSGEEGDEGGSGEEGDESGSGEEGDESGSGEEGDESGSGEEGDESGSGEEGDEGGSGEEGDESGSGEEGDEGGDVQEFTISLTELTSTLTVGLDLNIDISMDSRLGMVVSNLIKGSATTFEILLHNSDKIKLNITPNGEEDNSLTLTIIGIAFNQNTALNVNNTNGDLIITKTVTEGGGTFWRSMVKTIYNITMRRESVESTVEGTIPLSVIGNGGDVGMSLPFNPEITITNSSGRLLAVSNNPEVTIYELPTLSSLEDNHAIGSITIGFSVGTETIINNVKLTLAGSIGNENAANINENTKMEITTDDNGILVITILEYDNSELNGDPIKETIIEIGIKTTIIDYVERTETVTDSTGETIITDLDTGVVIEDNEFGGVTTTDPHNNTETDTYDVTIAGIDFAVEIITKKDDDDNMIEREIRTTRNGNTDITVINPTEGNYATLAGDDTEYRCEDGQEGFIPIVNLYGLGTITRDKDYCLAKDIDLAEAIEAVNQYIDDFGGEFDGNYHKITGLKLNGNYSDPVALFATISGTVKNLIIENATIENGGHYTATLVKHNEGTIENVGIINSNIVFTPLGRAESGSYIAGLAGLNLGTIKNSYVSGGKVNLYMGGASYAAGLVGTNGVIRSSVSGTIENCYASIEIISGDSGGLVGMNTPSGVITNSYFDTTATGQNNGVYLGDSSGVTGITEDAITENTFDWSRTIWNITAGNWPIFQSQN